MDSGSQVHSLPLRLLQNQPVVDVVRGEGGQRAHLGHRTHKTLVKSQNPVVSNVTGDGF